MTSTTIIGLLAGTCTTISFFPQAIKTIRTKQTKDLSLGMYLIFTFGMIMWLIYGILLKEIPIIAANSISVILSGIILGMKIKYG